MKKHPVRSLQVVSQEVWWEGELVLFINPNLGASTDMFLRESLDGLTLSDWHNKGDHERVENAEAEVEELKKGRQTLADLLRRYRRCEREIKLSLASSSAEWANQYAQEEAKTATAIRERDEARAFAEKVLKDYTAWITWARSMGYTQ